MVAETGLIHKHKVVGEVGLAQGAIFEGAEDQLVVASNQFVGPAFELAAAGSVLNRSVCSSSIASSGCSARGSSTCSIVWNGNTTLQTVLVFPFQTSST